MLVLLELQGEQVPLQVPFRAIGAEKFRKQTPKSGHYVANQGDFWAFFGHIWAIFSKQMITLFGIGRPKLRQKALTYKWTFFKTWDHLEAVWILHNPVCVPGWRRRRWLWWWWWQCSSSPPLSRLALSFVHSADWLSYNITNQLGFRWYQDEDNGGISIKNMFQNPKNLWIKRTLFLYLSPNPDCSVNICELNICEYKFDLMLVGRMWKVTPLSPAGDPVSHKSITQLDVRCPQLLTTEEDDDNCPQKQHPSTPICV